MLNKLFIAPLAAVLLAGAANASPLQTLRLKEQAQTQDQLAEVIGVETHRSAVSVIAQDALYGGIAGLAIGAGVALITDSGNWGRDLALGAGIGLLAGGIYGAVDAASYTDRKPIGFDNGFRAIAGHF